MSGALLQAALRNPLASPDITGIGPGAVLGAVAATTVGLAGPGAVTLGALIGALFGGSLLWFIGRSVADPAALAVRGVLLAAILSGATILLLTARPRIASAAIRWLAGSLNGRQWSHWQVVAPTVLVAAVAAVALGGMVSVIRGGDVHATSVGLPPSTTRGLILVTAAIAAAGPVAAAGSLPFVGFVAGHLGRRWVGPGAPPLAPLAAAGLLGAALVSSADALSQFTMTWIPATPGSQRVGVPPGAITALIGATALVFVIPSLRSRDA